MGVASASYWSRRAAGIGIRLAHKLLGPERSIEMLIFADDLELLGVGVLVAQLVWRHSCTADRLPVVVRFPAGPRVSLKW